MIEIRKLDAFPAECIPLITAGYTSHARYRVEKSESEASMVIQLTLEELPQPYTRQWERDEQLEKHYASVIAEHSFSLAAYDDGKLVGIAICEPRWWNKALWVWEFHIDAAYKRQGIGRRLMDELAEKASQAGLRVLVCETQNTNMPAIQFYRAAGFEIDAVDLSLYSNTDVEDFEVALFMKRKLKEEA